MDLTCLGEILIDLFPAEIGRRLAEVTAFHPKPGGAPANVAVAAARLGLHSAFIGKVGDDAFGQHLIETLRQEGVDTRGMRVDPYARTTLAFIAMPDVHHAEFVFYRNPGADLQLREGELDRLLLGSTRGFHCGSLSLVDEPARTATHTAAQLAHAAGALVSFDVNFRPSLWPSPQLALENIHALLPHASLLKVNEVELRLLAHLPEAEPSRDWLESGTQTLMALGPQLVVVTLGAHGSFFATAGGSGFVPAFRVSTVDATGCGDAFLAGLVTRLLESPTWQERLVPARLQEDLRFANAVGAITSLTQGAIPALPSRTQVEQFLGSSQTLASPPPGFAPPGAAS